MWVVRIRLGRGEVWLVMMREDVEIDRGSAARAVVVLKLAHIHICISPASSSRFCAVQDDRRRLYVSAPRKSVGFGDLLSGTFGSQRIG